MKIETQFSLGDTVYFMFENEVMMGKITSIDYSHCKNRENGLVDESLTYYVEHDYHFDVVGGNCSLFSTQQELFESLKVNTQAA